MSTRSFGSAARRARRRAYETAARLCEREAEACLSDIVPGDDLGAKYAHARAGALLTAAADIRAIPIVDRKE